MNDSSRYIVAIVLAMIILFTWQILFPVEQPIYEQENRQETLLDEIVISETNNIIPEAVATCNSEKIIIDNERLEGSIDLCGAQINEIFLKKFNNTADIDSDYVQLFKKDSYWVESGWLAPRGANFLLPDENTLWTLESQNSVLSPNTPIIISWENGNGLKFIQKYSLDENYLFSFTQEVENNTPGLITLFPFHKLSRQELPTSQTLGLLHEGPAGWFDEKLDEQDYDDIYKKDFRKEFKNGWIGISDKYWATAITSLDEDNIRAIFKTSTDAFDKFYRIGYIGDLTGASSGESVSSVSLAFIGAKEVKIIQEYSDNKLFNRLDLIIDLGWFFFLA